MAQKSLILMKCHLSIFSSIAYNLGVISLKSLPDSTSCRFSPFSSKIFVVLAFKCKFLVHFNFMFIVKGMHINIQFPPILLVEKTMIILLSSLDTF